MKNYPSFFVYFVILFILYNIEIDYKKLYIFKVRNINYVKENEIITKTIGNGLEPYKNKSRLWNEEIKNFSFIFITIVFYI